MVNVCDGSMRFFIGYYSEEIRMDLVGLYVDELDMREVYCEIGDKFYVKHEVEDLIDQLENTYKFDDDSF